MSTTVAVTGRLAEGETSLDVPFAGDRDEIGDMARALRIFRENAVERARLEAESRTEIEKRAERGARLDALTGSFDTEVEAVIAGLEQAAGLLDRTASVMTDIAGTTETKSGEAGGFAIVASEVKNLANQTGQATEEIRSQIARIQSETEGAVSAITRIGGVIGLISQSASSIASAVEEQTVASQEIARNIEGASNRTRDVSTNIADVVAASREAGESAGRVREASSEVAAHVSSIRDSVRAFLKDVRAA